MPTLETWVEHLWDGNAITLINARESANHALGFACDLKYSIRFQRSGIQLT